VNGVLLTSDGYIVLVRRSLWVGEHPGMIDTPGGHPEPSNIDSKFNMKLNPEMPSVSILDEKAVVNEIFRSQKDELCVELNIPEDMISDPKLLSIGRVSSGNGRLGMRSNYYFMKYIVKSMKNYIFNHIQRQQNKLIRFF
jgi:hypothetical protein